jgi:serine/threonine protein kinase
LISSITCCEICEKKKIKSNNTKMQSKLKIKKRIEDFEETLLKPMENENDNGEIQLEIKNIDELKINTNQCVLKRYGDPRKYYTWDDEIDELGRGAYGIVYKVKSILLQQERAMKKICKSGLNNPKNSSEFINEIKILQNLDHPNIIKIYELIEDEKYLYIVTEYISHGNFFQKLTSMNNNNNKNEIFVGLMLFQIISAVCYLHKNKIVHGDLKPENIMLSSGSEEIETNKKTTLNEKRKINGENIHKDKKDFDIDSDLGNGDNNNDNINDNYANNNLNYGKRKTFNTSIKLDLQEVDDFIKEKNNNLQNKISKKINNSEKVELNDYLLNAKNFQFKNMAKYHIKLIDFGCSKVLSRKNYKYKDVIGTTSYMAPEVALNEYNEKCDIWSCGVIMFVMLTGVFPFNGKTEKEIERNILNYNFSTKKEELEKNISDLAIDLLKKLLTYYPNYRISAKEALNHPFFSKNFNTNNIFNENINCDDALFNMKNYNSRNSLVVQKFMDSYLSYNFINPEEVDKLRKVFKLLDIDNDGMLSKNELYSGFSKSKIPMNKEELDEFLIKVDGNSNSLIEYEEFIRICSDKIRLFSDENLKIAFETLDNDNDGFITKLELKNTFFEKCNLPDDILNEFIKQFNSKDEDDKITFENFIKVMKQGK